MPSTSGGAGPYSHLIITPDIKTPDPHPYDALAARATARAGWLEDLHQQTVSANAMRENAADSPGFSVGHEKAREFASNIDRGVSYFRGQATLYSNMAEVMRDVRSAHDSIDRTAHDELGAAKTNFERAAIIATHHGDARIAAVNGVEMLGAHYTYFKSNYGSDLIALTGRLGDLAQDSPGPQPIPDDTGGIKKPIDNHRPHTTSNDEGQQPVTSGDASKPLSGDNGASRGALSSQGEAPASESPLTSVTAPMTPAPSRAPGMSSPGFPGGLSGGGLPGGGGGMPGGLSGLGGGNPLSALTSGAGGLPGATTPCRVAWCAGVCRACRGLGRRWIRRRSRAGCLRVLVSLVLFRL